MMEVTSNSLASFLGNQHFLAQRHGTFSFVTPPRPQLWMFQPLAIQTVFPSIVSTSIDGTSSAETVTSKTIQRSLGLIHR
jgi:hypothetical protein